MPEKKSLSKEEIKNRPIYEDVVRSGGRARETYILKLYISGMTLRSTRAIGNIRRICEDYLPGRCDLEIVDIFEHPARAREAQVIAAPTLVKKSPLPVHRMVGDLSQTEKVLVGLNITTGV